VRWSFEIEIQRIANVQRQNLVSLLNHFIRHASQIADSIANIVETGCGGNLARLSNRHGLFRNVSGQNALLPAIDLSLL
jgi:hypothetical protein